MFTKICLTRLSFDHRIRLRVDSAQTREKGERAGHGGV
jgi:hypothetical protein